MLLLLLAGCQPSSPPPQQAVPEVSVITLKPQTLDVTLPRLAQLESSREVKVVARVSGFLEKISYQEGALLKEGEEMFVMDKRPFEAQLAAAKGELAAAEARLWTAEANLKRIRPLTEADAMSQSDLDQAIGSQRSAQAAVYAARAKVDSARLELGYTTLHAPVTGLSGDALQREGAYLNSSGDSAYLSYVAQIDPIWVNFSISQNELEQYRRLEQEKLLITPELNQYSFELVMSDGSLYPLKGKLDFASPIFDSTTATFQVRAVVPNPDFLLRPGMFVKANILGGKRPNAILVPQKAVIQQGNDQVVMLVNSNSEIRVQPVTTGNWQGDQWIIEKGLKGGEQLVVSGYQKVRPGMRVKALHYLPPDRDAQSAQPSPPMTTKP
ncbi:efflux RND transporter periplasmic adaptor subunit [Aestuariirhabdus litorea]|uniref:efflux RND transporter periplasmic adaptor subunit n=1 Tax=Aestuariirhabdus litorea TaxID=2528527 RepID=UPI0013E336CD|nr:efflux RND transporter periplasmic adaptor subunit [Aestuariirhabdus litorea]